MENQYKGGITLKGGLGQFANPRGGGLARKKGVDTLMHTMKTDLPRHCGVVSHTSKLASQ